MGATLTDPRQQTSIDKDRDRFWSRASIRACEARVEDVRHLPLDEEMAAYIQLLKEPSGVVSRLSRRTPRWRNLQLQIVERLSDVESDIAIYPLTEALLSPHPAVSSLANDSLRNLGNARAWTLVARIRQDDKLDYQDKIRIIHSLKGCRSEEVQDLLLSVLRGEHTRSFGQKLTAACRLFVLWVVTGILAGFFVPPAIGLDLYLPPFLVLFVLFPRSLLLRHEAHQMITSAGDALESCVTADMLPALLDLYKRNLTVRAAALPPLAIAVQQVAPNASVTLSADQERCLNQIIDGSAHVESSIIYDQLVLNAIRSLEFIGTGRSAPFLEQFILSRPVAHDAGLRMNARTEAERVLPILRARRIEEEHAQLLLRAADHAPKDELLRAATNLPDHETDRTELLRAGE